MFYLLFQDSALALDRGPGVVSNQLAAILSLSDTSTSCSRFQAIIVNPSRISIWDSSFKPTADDIR